jgi:protein-L-isoaspartate(D-aspartate) O-methyltransferase
LDNTAKTRTWFANELRLAVPIRSQRVVAAFSAVPRENFVGPGPWTLITKLGNVEVRDPNSLYHSAMVMLKADSNINNGPPDHWGAMCDTLALAEGESVLQVGAGTGYYSAILAECVGNTGHVTAVEIEADLARQATDNLLAWKQVEVICGDATKYPRVDVDVIVAFAGLNDVPLQWLNHLRNNGRLLLPFTVSNPSKVSGKKQYGGRGAMLFVRRKGSVFEAQFVRPAHFIHCIGGRNDVADQRLAAAFARGNYRAVRSLRVDTLPDETCWMNGAGWWLSTVPQ